MPAKKIVVSNDAELLAVLDRSFCQREGFEVVPIQDARAGFRAVEEDETALAILDLALMGDQALECCRRLKQDGLLAGTPVLLLLPERAAQTLITACRSARCDAVLHRPLTADALLDAACDLLGISRRLAKRFPVSFALVFLDPAQKRHPGHCLNLNSDGLFVATTSLFPVGTALMVEFSLAGSDVPLLGPARVAWVNHPEWRKKNSMPCGMGLQFAHPGRELGNGLRGFLVEPEAAC